MLLLLACGEPASDAPFEADAAAVAANNRGVGQMGAFDYEGAAATFGALLEQHPDWADARVNLAIATLNRQQEGDEQRALELLEQVLRAEPEHLRARYTAGILRLYLGEPGVAEAHFRAVAEADPSDAYAAYNLGQSLAQQSRFEDALVSYQRAREADPLLRSAHFAASRTLQRLGRDEEAARALRDYEELERNPQARLAELKYTLMGAKALAITVNAPDRGMGPRPQGPIFGAVEALATGAAWRTPDPARAGLTAVRLRDDGAPAVFVPAALAGDAPNAVLVQRADPAREGGAAWRLDPEHPLAAVDAVNAALWGDFDNDGRTDAYLLRRGENQLWRQTETGWMDVTAATRAGGAAADSVDGAFFDADHDGDLDLFLVNADAPNELLNNDRDGSFRSIGAERGIAGDGRASRGVVPVDLDGDRDLDLVVVNEEPPHEVYWNDRIWQYRPAPGFDALRAARFAALVAGDLDADGRPELYALSAEGELARWAPDVEGEWRAAPVAAAPPAASGRPQLALADVTGDGALEVLHSLGEGWAALQPDGDVVFRAEADAPLAAFAPVVLDPAAGPAVMALGAEGGVSLWRAGPGRHGFVSVALTGREDRADALRSNTSGIGARLALRVGSRWTVSDTLRATSGPGQSLQPVSFGLGGADRVDFVAIDWSDGVFQTELDLAPGPHVIVQTQRQRSSCPLVFAWDGERYAFVSDVLGVAGLGLFAEPGREAPHRAWENLLLPPGLPRAQAGRVALKVAQMMEEVAYLDAARLVAYDLPPGWDLLLDERLDTAPPRATGATFFFREERQPSAAVNDRGDEVGEAIARRDFVAAPPGARDPRFLGMLAGEHVLALRFDEPLARPGQPALLVIDGWVEYPYAQTVFAAWQAGLRYRPLTLESRAPGEAWRPLLREFGYPAGMPRRMALPLPELPAGASELRLRTNQQIYLDRIAVAYPSPNAEVRRRALPLVSARVRQPGFAHERIAAQRRPEFDYDVRKPFADARYPAGWYTQLGPARELVQDVDDAVAVLGPGEEIHLEFAALRAELPPGWSRRYVLETNGWVKDYGLFTRASGTVGPLPATGHAAEPRERLHARYNTRFRSGRQGSAAPGR